MLLSPPVTLEKFAMITFTGAVGEFARKSCFKRQTNEIEKKNRNETAYADWGHSSFLAN
jgi:hypothetical protein